MAGSGADRARWPCGWVKVKGTCGKADCTRCGAANPLGDDALKPSLAAIKKNMGPDLLKLVAPGAAGSRH
eukprot:1473619-Prymnesium_polylepis.1